MSIEKAREALVDACFGDPEIANAVELFIREVARTEIARSAGGGEAKPKCTCGHRLTKTMCPDAHSHSLPPQRRVGRRH